MRTSIPVSLLAAQLVFTGAAQAHPWSGETDEHAPRRNHADDIDSFDHIFYIMMENHGTD